MASPMTFSFQDANSHICEHMIHFHDIVMIISSLIITMIMYMMYWTYLNKFTNRFMLEGHLIELIWTIMPMLILIFLAFPSLKILYISDFMINPNITIKTIGHQWYWSYEYSEINKIEFDSYMIKEFNLNNFRLLDVDNRMIIPLNIPIRILTTSSDVIHSWTVPSLGIKMDSTPGRLNQILLNTFRPGLFFGQCSEICGANHSFMPIVVESTSPFLFMKWLMNY